jgi:hypothetical protein
MPAEHTRVARVGRSWRRAIYAANFPESAICQGDVSYMLHDTAASAAEIIVRCLSVGVRMLSSWSLGLTAVGVEGW